MEELENKPRVLLGIQMTEEEFDNLICKQAKGKQLKVIDGQVVAIDCVPTEEEKTQNRIAELKQLLASQDYQTIKYVQGELTEEKFAEVTAQCQVWRDEINELEDKQMLSTTMS